MSNESNDKTVEIGTIDIVMPVHNEGESIEDILREIYSVIALEQGYGIRFVLCEDGSTDNTVGILNRLKEELPIHLISEKRRKGYSAAIIDGCKACTSDYVLIIDSDGQCDPKNFQSFIPFIAENDLVAGYRNPRLDPPIRLAMSHAFGFVYQLFFDVPLKDPSCAYLLVKRKLLSKIMSGNVGILKQGFEWEFLARAVAHKAKIAQLPIKHRKRTKGTTQVYRPSKVPRIAYEHLLGLLKLRSELKKIDMPPTNEQHQVRNKETPQCETQEDSSEYRKKNR